MIVENLIDENIVENLVENVQPLYFIHRQKEKKLKNIIKTNKPHFINIMHYINNHEELKQNDWELHKKLIKKGRNPNEIAKIIRNDEIEKLQEISSQANFDFNQIIQLSLYEKCSFINHENVTIIDYAAFFSAVKCFKYLIINGANVFNTGKYAVAGGNIEIVHLCEQNHSSFEGTYEAAIEFHQNDIFKYLYENNSEKVKTLEENNFPITGNSSINFNSFNNINLCSTSGKKGQKYLNILGHFCILYHNYEILSYLIEKRMKSNEKMIYEIASLGNLYLIKYFNEFPDKILFHAIESGNDELEKFILERKVININLKNKIFLIYFLF